MSENQYIQKDIMEFCNRVLDSSGEVAMKYFRQIRSLSLKGDTSPVTQADHDIESLIREEINIAYPGHNIITEDVGEIIYDKKCRCVKNGKRFIIHGRIKEAEIRGCSDT